MNLYLANFLGKLLPHKDQLVSLKFGCRVRVQAVRSLMRENIIVLFSGLLYAINQRHPEP